MQDLADAAIHAADLEQREGDGQSPGPDQPADANARAGDAVEPFEAGLAREDRVTPELALDHGLDGAADEHDPESGVADLRAERGGGDELAGSDDRRREHDAGPDTPQRGDERRRRGLDGAARQRVGILGRRRVNG